MSELTTTEQGRLDELEGIIERGQKTFVEVGQALAEVRDSRLYRLEFSTFESYCQKRWGWSRRTCNQLISAKSAVENLGAIAPKSESQVRPLTKLNDQPEKQKEAWEKACRETEREDSEGNPNPTAKEVKAAVDKQTEEPAREKEKAKRLGPYVPSEGMELAGAAIAQLDRISANDAELEEAMAWVIKFCCERAGTQLIVELAIKNAREGQAIQI